MTIPKSIAASLVKAQAAVRPVEKTSANAYHKYRYASAEAMIQEGREALHGAGLALVQAGWSSDGSRLTVAYVLAGADGEAWEMPVHHAALVEEKGKPMDKAEATALTYSLSYTLRGLLLMARVEEGTDTDQRDDSRHEPERVSLDARLRSMATKDALWAFLKDTRARIAVEADRDVAEPWVREAATRVGGDPDKAAAYVWPLQAKEGA